MIKAIDLLLKTVMVLVVTLAFFWFLQILTGELQEQYDCTDKGGLWIKDRCIPEPYYKRRLQ